MVKYFPFLYDFFIRKYYGLVLLLCLISSGNILTAQTRRDIQNLRQVAIQSIQDKSSQQYQKYLDYYSKIDSSESLAFRVKASLIRGKYRDAVFYLDQLRKSNKKSDPYNNFSYHFMAYQVGHILGIEAETAKHKESLLPLLRKVPSILPIELATDTFAFDFLPKIERKKYLEEALKIFRQKKDFFFISRIYYFLGMYELQDKKDKTAYKYFENSEIYSKKNNTLNTFYLYGISGRSKILMNWGKHEEAFKILDSEKNVLPSVADISLKEKFYKDYAKSASFLSLKKEVEWASRQFISITNENNEQQQKARSLLVDNMENAIIQETEQNKIYWRNIYIAIISLFLISFGILLLRKRYKISKNKFKDLDNDSKIFAIPDKTEKKILEKLNEFEASMKFTKASISLKMLSLELDTNPKYLSEVINRHKGSNFNTYINNLRIDYILDKLDKDEEYRKYKVSYLAEESGFSSHSLFTTTFKNKVGRSPIDYIKDLEKEI